VLDGTQWTVPVQPKSDGKAKPYQLKEIRHAFIRHNL
jgi:hypothetical protein